MDVPLEISYREVDKSDYIENLIREKAAKLEKVCDHITSLRVAVELEHKTQAPNAPYRVRLDINVAPGQEFAIKRDGSNSEQNRDLSMLLRDAFEAAWNKLRKLKDKQQGRVKNHPEQQVSALVGKLFPKENYGFLRTLDGRDVYFHRNAVVGRDFDDLRPGAGVTFNLEQGEKGLQATSVHVVSQPSE